MVNSIHDLLINILPSDKSQGGWVADKKKTLCYQEGLDLSAALPIEKAYALMHRQLKAYSKTTHLTTEDKATLLSLKTAVEKRRDDYLDQHKGFFGRIALFFNGLGSGHIDTVSKQVIADIDRLSHKANLTLDVFLKQVPFLEPTPEMEFIWVYNKRSGQIEVKDSKAALKKYETDDLLTVLKLINSQLSAFHDDEPLTRFEQQSLRLLRDDIRLKVFAQKYTEPFDPMYKELMNKIELFLKAVPTDKPKDKWEHVFHEILNKGDLFVVKMETCLAHLDHLKTLAQEGKVKVSSELKSFFLSKDEDKTLVNCEKAYEEFFLQVKAFNQALHLVNENATIKEKTVALSKLLESATFTQYVEGALKCMEYRRNLSSLSQDLRAKNTQTSISEYFNHNMGEGGDRASPEDDFMRVVQRLPQLLALSKELLMNTEEGAVYKAAFNNYTKILSFAKYQEQVLAAQSGL